MLQPRIIPTLLVRNKGLVKTVKFKDDKYIGDPINTVRIFNEKEVDELIVLDIDASTKGYEPDFKMIERLAQECNMPLCYGGGIKNIQQAQRAFSLGVEKIAISSVAIDNPKFISELANSVGSQSVVVVLDVKKKLFGGYELATHNGSKKRGIDPIIFAKKVQQLGAGEIVVNSIDNDGTMQGYDLNLIDSIKNEIDIPLTVLGGAKSVDDFKEVIRKHKIIGVSAGSLFVFKGKYKAVLISYPNSSIKNEIFSEAL